MQEYKPILVTHQRYTMQMCGLELVGGEMLQVTPEHRFYSNGEWVEARELNPGDLLQNKDGDYVTILGIENLPHYEKVYNFDVQDNENYYVTEEGILVHNGCGSNDDLPSLDNTGKVHGELPDIKDLKQYDVEDLEIFRDQLKKSVQERIRKTSEVGADYTAMQNKQHGERQAAEQALIHAIDKILGK